MGPSDRGRVIRDRLALLRERRAGAGRAEDLGQGTYLGRVYDGGSMPSGAERYVLTHPLAVSGDEAEGLAHSGGVDAGRTVPVLILGLPPAVGDDLVAKLVDGRWVAEKRAGGGTIPGGPINIPGCLCQNSPETICVRPNFAVGTPAFCYEQYRDSTLRYYATSPPPYLTQSSWPGPAYYSTATWSDSTGLLFYYHVTCFSTQFSLGVAVNAGGTWQAPGFIYQWAIGGRGNPNTCIPLDLKIGFGPLAQCLYSFTASEGGCSPDTYGVGPYDAPDGASGDSEAMVMLHPGPGEELA